MQHNHDIDMAFGRYTLTERLGEGGMGVVYKAHDAVLGREVAVKILSERLVVEGGHARQLYTEAQAAARLAHPNVVTIHDVGEHDGQPFIVMEYIQGRTLKALITDRDAPMTANEITATLHQTCQALQLAHQQHVLHRDIKSENIMMMPDGRLKVLDFGIARVQDLEDDSDSGELIAGTVDYMSPEQLLGEPVDSRTDIYSLGVVLYELLTAELPFPGDSMYEVMIQHINTLPRAPSILMPDADPGLSAMSLKMMAKAPADRYQHIEELIYELDHPDEMAIIVPDHQDYAGTVSDLSRSELFHSDLIGRDQEMDTLREAFDELCTGRGGIIAVTGEAGIGKSRLLSEMQTTARDKQVWILTGASYYRDMQSPFLPFVEALRTFFQQASKGDQARLSRFIAEETPELRLLAPQIDTQFHQLTQVQSGTPDRFLQNIDAAQAGMMQAFIRVFFELARIKPVLISLDDFHWADSASIQLLHYLALEIHDHPVLIMTAYRDEDLSDEEADSAHTLTETLRRMSRNNLYRRIDLRRLDGPACAALLEGLLKRASLSAELYEMLYGETEGNPFFLIETLRRWHEDGLLMEADGGWQLTGQIRKLETSVTDRVYDLLMHRIEQLSDEQREMLQIAAVGGVQFNPVQVGHILDIGRVAILRMLHRLGPQLIAPAGRLYRFDHIKIRDILYQEIPFDLCRAYHHMYAEYIAQDPDLRAGGAMDDLALHRYLGGDLEAAIPLLIKSGADAERLFAFVEADRRYAWAMDAMDQIGAKQDAVWADLMLRAGGIAYRLGEWAQALNRFTALLDTGDQIGLDKKIMGDASLQLGRIKRRQGLWQEANNAFDASMICYQKAESLHGVAMVYQNIGDTCVDRGDWEQASQYYRNGLNIAHRINEPIMIGDLHLSLGVIASNLTEFDPAIEQYTRSIEEYEKVDHQYGLVKACNNLGMVYEDLQDWPQAQAYYERALQLCSKMGSVSLITYVYLNAAKMAVKMDDAARGEDLCQRALDLVTDQNDQLGIAEAYKIYGMLYVLQEAWEQAEFYLMQSRNLFQTYDNLMGVGEVYRELGLMYHLLGDPVQARQNLDKAHEAFTQMNAPSSRQDIEQLRDELSNDS